MKKSGIEDEVLEQVLNELKSTDAEVRYQAAARLGTIQDERAIEPLVDALPDSNSKVQYAAFSSLIKIGAPDTVLPLIDSLLRQPDSRVWGLLKLGIGMRLRNGLMEMVQKDDLALADRLDTALADTRFDEYQRALIVRLLGRTVDTRAVESLIDMLMQGTVVMQAAAGEALGSIGDARAIAPLMLFLNPDEDDRMREIAATALGRIGDMRAYDPLVARLQDVNEWVRAAAITALADLGDRRAVEPISALIKDENTMVQDAAFEALKRFSTRKFTTIL